MADTPILNYKGKYDGPEIDKAVELALGLENPESCPYYVHLSLSQPEYVLTIGLGDSEGNLFNYAEIDLPLESMVVNATYSNGNIILHLQDGTSTEPIPISALIAGLVSENRTIAGIDLKDNITQKELRDALDVYTKDSVDQLVSDLENTINETLNEMEQSLDDLSELTSEHDTQIKKNTSDITINRATLGYQSKNLLNHTAKTETKNGVDITVNTDGSITFVGTFTGTSIYYHQIYKNADGSNKTIGKGKYIVSGGEEGFGLFVKYGANITGENGTQINVKNVDVPITIKNETEFIGFFVSLQPAMEYNATIYPMLRSADVIDPTYEPYKPSVNERLVEVEESVSELTPQVDQNKSDILKAESEIEYNKIKWGRVLASGLPSGTAGWYKIASCELAVPSESTTRNATFLISHHSGTWGILKTHIIINPSNVSKFVMTSITQGINTKNIIGISKRENNVQKCEIWCKCTYAGEYYRFVILDNGSSGIPNNYNDFWQLHSTTAYQTNEPSDYDNKAETTDVIKDLSDRVTALETAAGITSE